jgi:hypothetical protein
MIVKPSQFLRWIRSYSPKTCANELHQHPEIYGAELDDEEAQQSETLKPLDLDNVEETRSPATSSNVPTETVVDPGVAKPGTVPVDADKSEDKVAETSEGVDTEQTKS